MSKISGAWAGLTDELKGGIAFGIVFLIFIMILVVSATICTISGNDKKLIEANTKIQVYERLLREHGQLDKK